MTISKEIATPACILMSTGVVLISDRIANYTVDVNSIAVKPRLSVK